MASTSKKCVVVDSIHGDICLENKELAIVNTATFQRLRYLKQLGMGHLTYPNATHTRFAHSIGVFKIMSRITDLLNDHDSKRFDDELRENLRLAALLHDIGHYPYSHLMEMVERVTLTEDELNGVSEKGGSLEAPSRYPGHEELGEYIILNQKDIREAIGGEEKAQKIASIFQRTEAADQQSSKLIHSSLDMDRLDYLMRDAKFAGVPYGFIDLNYILNSIRVSDSGEIGVAWKALTAAEHFLFSRMAMYRAVYYHKTTYGFEEACRQLLKRLRISQKYDIPEDGDKIKKICSSAELFNFTDEFVDKLIRRSCEDEDYVISALAKSITTRNPPKLVYEISGLFKKENGADDIDLFKERCRSKLESIASKIGVKIGQFLLCGPKPINFEERGSHFSADQARNLASEEKEELIKVFDRNGCHLKSIVDIPNTIAGHCSNHIFKIQRLYLVDPTPECDKRVAETQQLLGH